MTASISPPLTIEDFLQLPYLEESPAWEYLNGAVWQKPMPKARHSILQKRLLAAIDPQSEVYTALPELRCTFAGRSIVPDIAVIAWSRIPIDANGEAEDNFLAAPDWSIEILSPGQQANRVIDNLLHCLNHGCELGWAIDPDDRSVLVFAPQVSPQVYRGTERLPVLTGINLDLSAEQIFSWLRIEPSQPN